MAWFAKQYCSTMCVQSLWWRGWRNLFHIILREHPWTWWVTFHVATLCVSVCIMKWKVLVCKEYFFLYHKIDHMLKHMLNMSCRKNRGGPGNKVSFISMALIKLLVHIIFCFSICVHKTSLVIRILDIRFSWSIRSLLSSFSAYMLKYHLPSHIHPVSIHVMNETWPLFHFVLLWVQMEEWSGEALDIIISNSFQALCVCKPASNGNLSLVPSWAGTGNEARDTTSILCSSLVPRLPCFIVQYEPSIVVRSHSSRLLGSLVPKPSSGLGMRQTTQCSTHVGDPTSQSLFSLSVTTILSPSLKPSSSLWSGSQSYSASTIIRVWEERGERGKECKWDRKREREGRIKTQDWQQHSLWGRAYFWWDCGGHVL